MARITLDGIAHSYVASRAAEADYALKPLHHVWEQGRAYALLGPSGCGKTTLLNIISGLVIPSEGRLLFDDRDVTRLPTEQRNIAQVFQFPVIYDTMTVAENLAFPLRNRGMPTAGDQRPGRRDRRHAGPDADLDRRARGLTADAKQKISLGRGLVRADVSAVLFDEPLTVIDPALKWELRSKLKAVHRALDLLMIYVTHDQTEALTFADQVVVMNDGRVLQIGTPGGAVRAAGAHVRRLFHRLARHEPPARAASRARAPWSAATRSRCGAAYPDLPQDERLQLGVRPDFVDAGGETGGLAVQVRRIEDLGRKRLAHVTLGGHPLVATVPAGMRQRRRARPSAAASIRRMCSSTTNDVRVRGARRHDRQAAGTTAPGSSCCRCWRSCCSRRCSR